MTESSLVRTYQRSWLQTIGSQGHVWVNFSFAAVPVSTCLSALVVSWLPSLAKSVSSCVYLFFWVSCWTVFMLERSCPKTCYLSWPALPLRAASHGIPPKSFSNKLKSVQLKSKVCILLLSFLTPFRILNSTISWRLQPKLLLTTVSLGSSCSWISIPAVNHPLPGPFGTCTRKLSLTPSEALLAFLLCYSSSSWKGT